MNLNEAKQILKKNGFITEATIKTRAIESIDDVIEWILAEDVADMSDIKKIDSQTVYIKPEFPGDSGIKIIIDKNNNEIRITHGSAGVFYVSELTIGALNHAWREMTEAAKLGQVDEAKQILKNHGYSIRKSGRRLNEWLGMYKITYTVVFGNIDGDWAEEVEIPAYCISEAAKIAENMRMDDDKYNKGAILAIKLGPKDGKGKYRKNI